MPKCPPGLDNFALFRVDSGNQTFNRHAALLDESWLSRSHNGIQRAIIVRKLQRDHGTPYVQRLIEHISRGRAAQNPAGITGSGTGDKKADRNAPSRSA